MNYNNEIFDSPLKNENLISVRDSFLNAFREPFVKKDMKSHGPVWCNFRYKAKWMSLIDIDIDIDRLYLFVEDRKKLNVFNISFLNFIAYLNDRQPGNYPAMYVFDKSLRWCICSTGENSSLRPVKVMRCGTHG